MPVFTRPPERSYLPIECLEARAQCRKEHCCLHQMPLDFKTAKINNEFKLTVPMIYEQGDIGSCTANAMAGSYLIMQLNNLGKIIFWPSRLFAYYIVRVADNNNSPIGITDSGAIESDLLFCCKTIGVCNEGLWPYNTYNVNKKPHSHCFENAATYKIKSYNILPTTDRINNVVYVLGTLKKPVQIAIRVFSSFESSKVTKTGTVVMPKINGELFLGGHEMYLFGYNIQKQVFYGANSWGRGWGDKGTFTIPFAYIKNTYLTVECTFFTI